MAGGFIIIMIVLAGWEAESAPLSMLSPARACGSSIAGRRSLSKIDRRKVFFCCFS